MRYSDAADDYYRWLLNKVHWREYGSYERVLYRLFKTEFYWILPRDRNRADDGLELREDFAMEAGYPLFFWRGYLPDYCTVLEMMVALAQACEERIMGDPLVGDRTHIWFWTMMNKLRLDEFTDRRFDQELVDSAIETFLKREYSPNGDGSLFGVLKCREDLRDVELWYQLNYYLSEYYTF